jgi:hypothetical protein
MKVQWQVITAEPFKVRRVEKREQDQAIGRSRGGRTTKIHALIDELCRPVAFLFSEAMSPVAKRAKRSSTRCRQHLS